jgi:hypothetical protein
MMNTDNGKESLVCSRFGQIFPLLYQPPHLADEAPTSGLSVAGGTFQVSSLALMKMDTRMSEKVIQGLAFITQGIRNYFVTKSNTPVVMIGWQNQVRQPHTIWTPHQFLSCMRACSNKLS